jgi:malonyl-CoA decarboxylase
MLEVIRRLRRYAVGEPSHDDPAQLVESCRSLLTERGESNSRTLATATIEHYRELSPEGRFAFFRVLGEEFGPDPQEVLRCAQRYADEQTAENLIRLSQAAEPPRQELLRRLNRVPGGTASIVRMREQLLQRLRQEPALKAVDSDFQHLLSSWFNPGFLRFVQVDWSSPAALLEQIIQHEAVHEIDGWADLRRRLEPDRRCFAFFHPVLPEEPLIFVEVALLDRMPDAIAPLLDRAVASVADTSGFKVAAFYSISNCQPGLRGINLGNFLIKQVAEHLQREFPKLRTFCTLSPVPGFAAWLSRQQAIEAPRLRKPRLEALQQALDGVRRRKGEAREASSYDETDQPALATLCAHYLVHVSATDSAAADPVARFHLNNGARLQRINPAADLSRKGLKQSYGLMVNYQYDLEEIEANHERFIGGEVSASRAVLGLM